MIAEVSIGGIYVAPITLYAIVTLPVFLVLRTILTRLGFWRIVWHPALFETALYLSLLSLFTLL